jgi:hypothetical protein
VTAIKDQMRQARDKWRSWSPVFRLGIIVSIVWLALVVALLGFRAAEFWPPFEAAKDGRLPLNAIGDTLAGMFAPLAFLWLFVATSLQREELEETRRVLKGQMDELKRTADETNRRTELMRLTLEATRTRDVFDEFGLRLYYIAQFTHRENKKRVVRPANGQNPRHLMAAQPDLADDRLSLDHFIHVLALNAIKAREDLRSGVSTSPRHTGNSLPSFVSFINNWTVS